MLKPWWELFPDRLAYELRALEELGIPYERDEGEFAKGRLVLRVRPTIGGETIDLVAKFPDFYPYLRFEVLAPSLDLPRHQNPHLKNLCLIGRATSNWSLSHTLAQLITDQLPLLLAAARSKSQEEVREIEEQQGEPASAFCQYQPNAILLVDSNWKIDAGTRSGRLLVGVAIKELLLRGAVLEVRDSVNRELATAEAPIREMFPDTLRGRWVWLREPLKAWDAAGFLEAVLENHREFRAPEWQRVHGGQIDVIGAVFEEEVGWWRRANGWVFLVRYRQKQSGRGPKFRTGAYLVRAGRAGRTDLSARTPELQSLARCRVAVVGLGCIGAPSIIQLAKAGIGEIRILDDDIVEPGTVGRWPLGLETAGLLKAEALRLFISRNYPHTKINAIVHRIGDVLAAGNSDLKVTAELLDGVDLLYDASAEVGIQRLLSDIARTQGISYICVSTTHGAWGGRVVRIRPTTTAGCWSCLQHFMTEGLVPVPLESPTGFIQPEGCASPTFAGAAFDIEEIVLTGVRLAVGTLCSKGGGGYPDVDWDVAILTLRDGEGRLVGPRWETFPLTLHAECRACKER